ncbi:hypothetical protein RJ640_026737 [Escallonia rubra]|uniref:Protein JASON-like n=1 Tax=Escallonia rubra TaxID=112253 RepID=A0AA88U5Q9_9ASTE|nr:hypothetical protein RJ640_026737 [Escallonia rubra]
MLQAKFLKACGTLPETPFEIRKASAKLKDSTTDNVDSESVKFHSWLPSTSIEKPNIDEQPDQPPTPMKLREEWVMGSASSTQTSISSITSGRSDTRVYNSSIEASGVENGRTDIIEAHSSQTCKSTASSVSPRHLVASVQCRNKSVRFDCESDASSFSSESCSSEIKSNKYEQAGNRSVSKPSPYPTPLKLSGEMQTPGTVFPGYLETAGNGRNPRIRSQYVYSVLNPVENLSQWKVLNDDYSSSNQQSDHLRESLEQDNNYTPKLEVVKRESSVEKEMKVEASLSAWLKPPSDQPENTKYYGPISRENACFGRTPGDRPILGVVATHWNETESSRISPKWWDGNGIPNSTNKYKEDQKVSWHATPFEERLEKALSEETSTSQRYAI